VSKPALLKKIKNALIPFLFIRSHDLFWCILNKSSVNVNISLNIRAKKANSKYLRFLKTPIAPQINPDGELDSSLIKLKTLQTQAIYYLI